MKKVLSIVLAVVMLLGCLSVTAFAATAYDLYINEVQVTAEGVVSNDAIKSGTVTYTAAENNNGIAKLTLDGATIVSTMGTYSGNDAIYTESDAIVIELIGKNTVNAEGLGFDLCGGSATFTGSGSLTVEAPNDAIYVSGDCTFSMSGTLTATSSGAIGIDADDNIFIKAGAGKITAYGNSVTAGAVCWSAGVISGYKTAIGSLTYKETDESNMTTVSTVSGNDFTIGGAVAKTVVLTAYPAPVSGSTDITAIKAAPFSYEIVFPTTVAEITAAGVYEVGQAKVTNVVSATDNTVISYTATTTDFKLSTNNSKIMPATYHTEEAATNAFPTTAVKVYENKAEAASIPSMWVKIAESDWNAAAAGTYTATVTFNFEAEEVYTVGDMLAKAENFPTTADNAWIGGEQGGKCYKDDPNLIVTNSSDKTLTLPLNTELAPDVDSDAQYYCVFGGASVFFYLQDNVLSSIWVSATPSSSWMPIEDLYTAPAQG